MNKYRNYIIICGVCFILDTILVILLFIFNFVKNKLEKLVRSNTNNANKIIIIIIILSILIVIIAVITEMILFSFTLLKDELKIKTFSIQYFINFILTLINSFFIMLLICFSILKKDKYFFDSISLNLTLDKNNLFKFLLFIIPLIFVYIIMPFILKNKIIFLKDFNKLKDTFYSTNLIELFIQMLLCAFIEELIFRYYIPNLFLNYYYKYVEYPPNNYEVYFSSILFVLAHFFRYKLKIFVLFPALFIFSLYIFLVKRHCKSIVYCSLIHFINNILVGIF
ncbi:MAG: CPBP family intramembrane glutamic endopeptidase [Candidatus Woesearchaeota archaeon]